MVSSPCSWLSRAPLSLSQARLSSFLLPESALPFPEVDRTLPVTEWMKLVFPEEGAPAIGALVNYGLSVWLGRPIIHRFADTKIAHMLLIDLPGVEKAEKYFADHGAVGTLIGRLIPAIRQLISIPAGLARMNMSVFLLCTCIGAGVWNTFLAYLGYFIGQTVSEEVLIAKVQHYSSYVKIALAIIFIIGFAYYVYRVIAANRATARRKQQ